MKKISIIFFFLFFYSNVFPFDENSDIKVTKLKETDASWENTKIVYPVGEAKITALLVEMQPKAKIELHHHEVPSFGYILEGQMHVQSELREKKIFNKGDVVIEMVNKKHFGFNSGDSITKFIVFYIGAKGLKNTIVD